MDEVTVIERLQTEIGELQIAFGLDRSTKLSEVVFLQARVEELELDAALEIGRAQSELQSQ